MRDTNNKYNVIKTIQELPHTTLRAIGTGMGMASMMNIVTNEAPAEVNIAATTFGFLGGYILPILTHTDKETLNCQKKKSNPAEWNAKQFMPQTLVTTLAVTCGALLTGTSFFGKKLEAFVQQADIMLPPMTDVISAATWGTTLFMANEVCKLPRRESHKKQAKELYDIERRREINNIGVKRL